MTSALSKLSRAARIDILVALLLFAVVFYVNYLFSRLDVDEHHDGLIFKVAFDIYHGAAPFRDTFTQYGLLLSLIHVAAMHLLEPTVFALRLVTVVAYAVTAVLMYVAARRFCGPAVAAAAVLVWLCLAPFYLFTLLPWSSSMALPFQMGMILCALAYVDRRRLPWLVAAGALAALAFWVRMPVGVLSLAALAFMPLCLAFTQRRLGGVWVRALLEIAAVVAGAAATSIPFLIYLVSVGAMWDWLLQTFLMAIYFGRTIPTVWGGGGGFVESLLNALFPVRVNLVWAVLPALVVLVAIGAWGALFFKRGADRVRAEQMFALAALCIASWPQYYPVTEERHVFWGATPMFVLAAALIGLALDQVGRLKAKPRLRSLATGGLATAVAAAAALLIAVPIGARLEAGRQRLASFSEPAQSPSVLRGLLLTHHHKTLLEIIDRDLRAAQARFPDAPVITTGYDALYLTFGERPRNWHPLFVYYDIGVAIYPDFPTALGRFVAERKPLIFSSGNVWPAQSYRAVGHYSNGISLLEPGADDAAPILRDLPPELAGSVTMHVRVPNRFNLRTPMRVTGHRVAAIPPARSGTLEFVFRPELVEGRSATVFTTLYGPDPGQGIQIHRAERDHVYEVSIGAARRGPQPVLSFQVVPRRCNHIALTWSGDRFELFRDGVKVDEARLPGARIDGRNQTIINNGALRQQYHVGLVDEIRSVNAVLTPAVIAQNASWAAAVCERRAPRT